MTPPWRIAITGVGLVTPLGLTVAENLSRLMRGESGIGRMPSAPNAAAACVPEFDVTRMLKSPKNVKLMGRPVRLVMQAAHEAACRSGISSSGIASERIGVYAGSGQTGIEYDEFFKALAVAWEGDRPFDYKFLGGMPSRIIDRYFSLRTLANAGIAMLSTEFDARGPSNNYVQGETASASALYNACADLLEGRADAAIVAGYDCLHPPSVFMAFRKASLLSGDGAEAFYAPFDSRRRGMVLGEGAAVLVLERDDHCRERGAELLGHIDGIGFASQTADRPGFTPLTADLQDAIRKSSPATDFDFVVARGLGTQTDDLSEALALSEIISDAVPVTAFKGATGYLGAATAIVELILALQCVKQGCLPALVGLTEKDPQIALGILRRPTETGPKALLLSSTFEGQIAAIRATAD
jgi:3-oxoacyl-(acyl-carrier-protein) synthase